jgi:hypothetical protein
MARKPIRRRNPKTAAEDRALAPVRRNFVLEMGRCPVTGGLATDCHEIAGGSVRFITKKERCFWLALSREGHEQVQYWPKAKQLALKLLQDPANFNLDRFAEVYRGKDGRISFVEIAPYLELQHGYQERA